MVNPSKMYNMEIKSVSEQASKNKPNIIRGTTDKTETKQATTQKSEKAYDKSQLDKMVEEVNKKLETQNIERQFRIDEDLNRPVITVVDKNTKEVLYQMPSEVALKISKSIGEMLGWLTDSKI